MLLRSEIESTAVQRRKITSSREAELAERHQTLIDDLEAAIGNRNIGSCADVLRRVADLFSADSGSFTSQQRVIFDDVMVRLVDEIEISARAAFGERLAAFEDAPIKISRSLALDDSIEVAGALLAHSGQLDDETLIAGAATKSQDHLLAISRQKSLPESVTDVLVERGSQEVVASTAANTGAQF